MAAQSKAFSATATTTATAPMTLQEVSTAYAAVLTELEKLKKNGKRNAKGGGKGKNKKQRAEGNRADRPDTTDRCDVYCFVHGAQNSHTSQQCKVMANQPSNFSPEQRKATGPNSPPGGSTSVRGRDPQALNPQ